MIPARFAWVLIVLLVCVADATAGSKAEKNFRNLSKDILKNLQKFWPVQATAAGIHTYDDRFTDYSPKSVDRQRKELRKYLARLYKYKSVKLPIDMDIDRRLLRSNCEIAVLRLLEFPYHRKNPALYLSQASDGIYHLLIQDYAPLAQRLDHIIGRMLALPEFLRQGQANLKNPPPVWLDHARNNVSEVIKFYQTVTSELTEQFPDRAGEIRSASQGAVAALNHFREFLANLTPGEKGSFAIGKEYYDYILNHEYFFDFDSDSLLRIGEKLFAESIAKYREYGQYLDSAGLLSNKPMFIPESITRQDVEDYYQWEIDTIRQFVSDLGLVTIPNDFDAFNAVTTPEILRSVINDCDIRPTGLFDAVTTGHIYFPPLPETLSTTDREHYFRQITERRFMVAVIHKTYPGHHLQLQIAAAIESDARRWQMNNELIEGWALYCEELAFDAGLYDGDPFQYWCVLRDITFHAARIILDVKLQTGQFDYGDAFDWLTTALETYDLPYVVSEIPRYTMDPGQPMSYLMGKRAILELRETIKVKEGDAFNLKTFHDRLLAEGSIPVSLIREKMLK